MDSKKTYKVHNVVRIIKKVGCRVKTLVSTFLNMSMFVILNV